MPESAEITTARTRVAATRAQLADTLGELESRVTAPVLTVRDKLDVVQTVRDNPWIALAAALGTGAAIAASGADRRAASAAVQTAKDVAAKGADVARETPSRTHAAVTGALDAFAARLAVSLITRLREDHAPSSAPSAS